MHKHFWFACIIGKHWNLLNRNVKYIWHSLVISRKLRAEAQAVAQTTSKITIVRAPWICIIIYLKQLDGQRSRSSFFHRWYLSHISVSKPLRKELNQQNILLLKAQFVIKISTMRQVFLDDIITSEFVSFSANTCRPSSGICITASL